MIQYQTKDGDRLDQICFKHYGTVKVVVQVLDANIGLEQHPPILPTGLLINLPEIKQPSEFDNADEDVWS